MYLVKLTRWKALLPDGSLAYETEEDWREDMAAASSPAPPLYIYDSGRVEINGKPVEVTSSQRTILKCLRGGMCDRLTVINAVISPNRQMTMSDPEDAMCSHIKRLNKKLGNYGYYIETDPTHYYFKAY